MIRRTLQGGLAAVVAMFALAPTAVAATGDHITPAPVVVTVPHHPHLLLPVPAGPAPVRYRAHRVHRCRHHVRHIRHAGYVRHTRYVRHSGFIRHTGYVRHVRRLHHLTGAVYHRRSTRVVGRVATRHSALNIRSGPGLGYRVVGHRRHHGRVLVVCKRNGSYVYGNPRWYRLAHGKGYVAAHYVRVWRHVHWC